MAINSIIAQPNNDSLNAAYRPIIIRVGAQRTDGTPIPPVVYCDIYINTIFYKTIGLTQYTKLNTGTNTEWEFDIQDALQEYLGKFLADVGETNVVEAIPIMAKVQPKFRSSGIDTNGFLVPEGVAPIQGTDDADPVSGSGDFAGNIFYVVNATLQHEEDQDLATHLNTLKQGTWQTNTFPLTHRPNKYTQCDTGSDSFPIITDQDLGEIVLHRSSGDMSIGLPCVGVSWLQDPDTSYLLLPDAQEAVAYLFEVNLTGAHPYSIFGTPVAPSWMTISIVGDNLRFEGTPTSGDVGTGIHVSVTVQNCAGASTLNVDDYIDVTACVAVAFSGGEPTLPDAEMNVAYSFDVTYTGSTPMTLSGVTKPSWMTVTLVGNVVQLRGTPTSGGTGISVGFTVSNCGGSAVLSQTIDIDNYHLHAALGLSIDSVTGTGVPALGSTGINGSLSGIQTGMSGSYSIVISGTVGSTTKLTAYVNGTAVDCVAVTAAGTYGLTISAASSADVIISIESGVC